MKRASLPVGTKKAPRRGIEPRSPAICTDLQDRRRMTGGYTDHYTNAEQMGCFNGVITWYIITVLINPRGVIFILLPFISRL